MDNDTKRVMTTKIIRQMKNTILYIALVISLPLSAQVGINTESPEATLDINGTLKVRTVPAGDSSTDIIFAKAEEGVQVNTITQTQLETALAKNNSIVSAGLASFLIGSTVTDDTDKISTLDLWTLQEIQGEGAVREVYFLAQQQRVTLPANTTSEGDGNVRRIEFIVIENPTPNGFADNDEVGTTDYDAIFQTKKYEMQASDMECVTDDTYMYETGQLTDLFLDSAVGSSYTTDGNGYDRAVRTAGSGYIKNRKIVFYDFGGKWIMTIND